METFVPPAPEDIFEPPPLAGRIATREELADQRQRLEFDRQIGEQQIALYEKTRPVLEAAADPLGTLLNSAKAWGKLLGGTVADIGEQTARRPLSEAPAAVMDVLSGAPGATRNIEAGTRGQTLPAQEELAAQPGAGPALARATIGTAESAPLLGTGMLVSAAQPELAPLVFGTLFGLDTYEQTGDPQAAIRAAAMGMALPQATEAGGEAGAAVAANLGVLRETGQKALEVTGNQLALQAMAHLANVPEYWTATADERKRLALETTFNMGMFLAAEAGKFNRNIPSLVQQRPDLMWRLAEKGLDRAMQTPEVRALVEGQAIAGGRELVQGVQPEPQFMTMARPGEDLLSLPGQLAAERARGEEAQPGEVSIGVGRPGGARPEVPATAPEPERGMNVIEEIRTKNARTKEQIQQLFPQLSREQAGQLRIRAWGTAGDFGMTVEPGAGPEPTRVEAAAPEVTAAAQPETLPSGAELARRADERQKQREGVMQQIITWERELDRSIQNGDRQGQREAMDRLLVLRREYEGPQTLPQGKPATQPKAPLPNVPGNRFRPTVPGTPGQERMTDAEEVRRAKVTTINGVRQLFGDATMPREKARDILQRAYPETTAPTAPTAPTPPAQPPAPTEKAEHYMPTLAERIALEADDEAGRAAVRLSGMGPQDWTPSDQREYELIKEYREQQKSKPDTRPEWGRWSEWTVKLADGREVKVVAHPTTYGPKGRTTIDLHGEAISSTGYRQHHVYETPGISLENYVRDLINQRAAEQAKSKPSGPASIAGKHGWTFDGVWELPGMGRQWAFTFRSKTKGPEMEGVTFYLPEGAKAADIEKRIREKEAEVAKGKKAAAPKPEVKPTPPAEEGSTRWQAVTPLENQPVKGSYVIMEASDLVTSSDPGYDPGLQPRDRPRAASKQQMLKLAMSLEPARLGSSPTTDLGAPIIDDQNQVLSGNGRTGAIRMAYGANSARAAEYKDWLVRNAADYGQDPATIISMKEPVLVRRVYDFGKLTKEEFARQSNQQQVAGMSDAEKAAGDAKLLLNNPGLMESFRPSPEGDVLAASNRDFLNAFIKATGDQAELMGKEGYNGTKLVKRVKNGILGALLGPERTFELSQLVEGPEHLGLKRVSDGLLNAAPRLMRFKGTPYDISGVLAQAVKDLVSIRTGGEKLYDFLSNKPLFADPGRTADSDLLVEYLHNARSVKDIAESLARYADLAKEALKSAQTGDIFGQNAPTRGQLLKQLYGGPSGPNEQGQGGPGPAGGTPDLPLGKPPAPKGAGGGQPQPEIKPPVSGPVSGGAPKEGAGEAGQVKPRIFTDDAAARARENLRNKLGRMSMGVDPTILADVVVIAGNVIERGVYKYADYVKEMLKELGAEFRPFFRAAYNQVREYTEAHELKARLSSREEVEAYEQAQAAAAEPGANAPGAGGQPELSGAVRGASPRVRPGVRVVDEGDLPAARSIVRAGQYTGPQGYGIDETQRLAINQALTAFFDHNKAAFLLGDGTGVGKTGTELVLAAESVRHAGKPSLIVTQNVSIIENRFKSDAAKFGVPLDRVEFATYSDLSRGKVPDKEYGTVIFDEAHNLKNAGSARNFRAGLVKAERKVFATATAMDRPTNAAYFLSELTGKHPDEIAHLLGYKLVTRVIGGEEREFAQLLPGHSWADVIDNIKDLRHRAVQNGQLIRREYPFFGQANYHNARALTQAQVKEQNLIDDYWEKRIEKARSPNARRNLAGQRTGELSRWLEIQKLPEVLDRLQEDLQAGKKVIVFAEGYNSTVIKGLEGAEVPGFLGAMARELDRRGIKHLDVFGSNPQRKARAAADFQSGKADVLLATPQSGGAGIDMDDVIGNAPRVAHFVTLNFSGDVFDQMMGRISRRNTASPAEVRIWRALDGLADRRREEILDRKLQVLRNIQAGQDLDLSTFVEQAGQGELNEVDTSAGSGYPAGDETQTPGVQGRQRADQAAGRNPPPGGSPAEIPGEQAAPQEQKLTIPLRDVRPGDRLTVKGSESIVGAWEPSLDKAYAGYLRTHRPDDLRYWDRFPITNGDQLVPVTRPARPPEFPPGPWERPPLWEPKPTYGPHPQPPPSSVVYPPPHGPGVQAGNLKPGDRIAYAGRLLVVDGFDRDPVYRDRGQLRVHLAEDPKQTTTLYLDPATRMQRATSAAGEVSEMAPPGAPPAGRETGQALHEAAAEMDAALRGREQGEFGKAVRELQRETGTPANSLKWFQGLRRVFAPQTLDESGAGMAGILRAAMGKEYEQMRRADNALAAARKEFDRTPVPRNWQYDETQPLPRNYEVMRAIDTGTGRLTPAELSFARTMRQLFDQAIDRVHEVSPNSLRDLYENYMPRIWKNPDQEALNRLLSHRPWEGPKSFLKQRSLEYFTEGLKLGLKPISDNPADVSIQKLGEMYRFVATRQAIAEAKQRGYRKFVYIYEKPPTGWVQADDPSSTVHKPPFVTVKEAFDAQVRAKTLELLKSLGVPHERLVKIGGTRWGFAEQGTGRIVTKFGGPDFVIWHELGHQMDWRYPELRKILPAQGQSVVAKELRALADLRYEGSTPSQGFKKYVRETPEKLANVFDAYVRAPEKFKATAPNVWREFNAWLDRHPEVRVPLDDIKPSLTLQAGQAQMHVGGPVLLGHWFMPPGAAQVLDNYLRPGLGRFQTFRTVREVGSLMNSVQLAGFFHGQFVMNDAFYSGFGLALYDAMAGQWARGAKELAFLPVSPFVSLYRGGKIYKALENPAAAEAEYQRLAKLAVAQNLRAGHGNYDAEFSRRWMRSVRESLTAPSLGSMGEVFWRAPFAAVEKAMYPVMQYLVPRMKLGIYARMAERVIADNPNADTLTLRRLLAAAADATEDRLGQVTYDNLFQSRVIKDTGQLAFRAYGWQLTKYRMILGGSSDWVRAAQAVAKGQKPEVTFRMTYLPAMVIGHALIGGFLHWALTGGKTPQQLKDYLFPETGLVDAYGQPVRLAIADFVKDVAADFHAFPSPSKMGAEWSRKLLPLWNVAAELYRNQDFYGTEIRSERVVGEPELDHLLRNLQETGAYLGKTAVVPFSVRASQRFTELGGNNSALAKLGPWFGAVPAPRYATQTPAETMAGEITRAGMTGMTQAQSAHARLVTELVRDVRTGKVNDEGTFMARAGQAKVKDRAELTRIQERVLWTPLQYQIHKMPLESAMRVFDVASDGERLSLAPFLAEKIQRAYDGGRLDSDTTKRWVQLVIPYYQRAGKPRP